MTEDWLDEDIPPIDDGPAGRNGKSRPSQFTLVRFCDIQLGKEPPYLVRGLIPREGLTVVWGPPKCGKTLSRSAMSVAGRWGFPALVMSSHFFVSFLNIFDILFICHLIVVACLVNTIPVRAETCIRPIPSREH